MGGKRVEGSVESINLRREKCGIRKALPNEERAIVSYYSSHVDYRLFQSVMVSNMKKANKQNSFPPLTT